MSEMKHDFAVSVCYTTIFSVLICITHLAVTYFSPHETADLVSGAYRLLCCLLLWLSCHRRKLDIFSGFVMGLLSLHGVYKLAADISILTRGVGFSPLLTVLSAICHFSEAILFMLLLLTCVTRGRKKFYFVPKFLAVVVILSVFLMALEIREDLIGLLFGIIYAAFAYIPEGVNILAAFAITPTRPAPAPSYDH